MNLEDDEEGGKQLKFPITLHISEGNMHYRLMQYDKAIGCFSLALEQEPSNIKSLVGRAKSHLRLAQYQEASQYAEKALKLNPKCSDASCVKGEAEYLQGDFEKSFLTYYRGLLLRPFVLDLKLGHQLCKKAIENSLNPDTRMKLNNKDVIGMNNFLHSDVSLEGGGDGDRILGRDHFFLSDIHLVDDLLQDENLDSIHPICEELLDYLISRKRFWGMREPKATANTVHRKKKKQEGVQTYCKFANMAKKCLVELEEGYIPSCFKICTETLGLLESDSSLTISERNKIKAETLRILGLACMVEGDLFSALEFHIQQLKIGEENDMPEVKSRAIRDIGESYFEVNEYESALMYFQHCLKFVETEELKSVLLYRIADCYVHLDDLDTALNHAHKCLAFAVSNKDSRFELDTTLVLAEIFVKSKDMLKAKFYFNEALKIAVEHKDSRLDDLKYLVEMLDEIKDDKCEWEDIVQISHELKTCKYS